MYDVLSGYPEVARKLEENAESWICPVDEVPADAMIGFSDADVSLRQTLADLDRRMLGECERLRLGMVDVRLEQRYAAQQGVCVPGERPDQQTRVPLVAGGGHHPPLAGATHPERPGGHQMPLAAYKVPRRFDFVEEFPRTSAGKIQKHRLATAATEMPVSRPAAARTSGRA